MVILVRCRDDVCTIALKTQLDELIREGLVSSFLHEGEWVAAGPPGRMDHTAPRTPAGRVTAFVSCF